jgi:hypothetical protein
MRMLLFLKRALKNLDRAIIHKAVDDSLKLMRTVDILSKGE